MKPQTVAINIAMIAVFLMCSTPARAEVVDGFTGKWKAVNNATIFEVFPDGSYKSTMDGVVIETGKMNATNGIWIIRADSSRVDKGSYTLNGNMLQLKGELVTTAWTRMSVPTASSPSAMPTAVTGSFASPATSLPTASAGTATTTVPTGTANTAESMRAEANARRLSDKEKAIQRFNEKYAENSGRFIRRVPGGVMNDRRARQFWRGY